MKVKISTLFFALMICAQSSEGSCAGRIEGKNCSISDIHYGYAIYHLGDEGHENFDIEEFYGYRFGELNSFNRPELKEKCVLGGDIHYHGGWIATPSDDNYMAKWGVLKEPFGVLNRIVCSYSKASGRMSALRLSGTIEFASEEEALSKGREYKDIIESKYGIELMPAARGYLYDDMGSNNKITSWAFSNRNVTILVNIRKVIRRECYEFSVVVITYRIPREDYIKEKEKYKAAPHLEGRMTLDDERNNIVLQMQKKISELETENKRLKKALRNCQSSGALTDKTQSLNGKCGSSAAIHSQSSEAIADKAPSRNGHCGNGQ